VRQLRESDSHRSVHRTVLAHQRARTLRAMCRFVRATASGVQGYRRVRLLGFASFGVLVCVLVVVAILVIVPSQTYGPGLPALLDQLWAPLVVTAVWLVVHIWFTIAADNLILKMIAGAEDNHINQITKTKAAAETDDDFESAESASATDSSS
jgi:hypothetical protein